MLEVPILLLMYVCIMNPVPSSSCKAPSLFFLDKFCIVNSECFQISQFQFLLEMNSASALVLVLIIVLASSVPLQDESRLLDSIIVDSTERSSDETESCGAGDYRCNNIIGKSYVNALRSVADVDLLKMGTETMLEYAIEHAKEMAKTGMPYHQNLTSLEVGCGSMLTGENIASVHISKKGELADEPAICSTYWNDRDDSRKNMLASTHTEVVIGIARDKNDYIYCSQLFASSSQIEESGPCSPASEIYPTPEPTAEYTEPTEEPHTLTASDGHIFLHHNVEVSYTDGTTHDMKLGCSDEGCSYCTHDESICLSEEKSIAVDIKAEATARSVQPIGN